MRRNLIYIIPLISTLLSCSDEVIEKGTEYLNGSEKTPLAISVTAPITKSTTRAFDGEFEQSDVLKAYVRHVKDGSETGKYDPVTGTGIGPTMANLKITSINNAYKGEANNFNTEVSRSILTAVVDGTTTPLYWDDFSNSSSDATDLRTSGHFLQSYYGYCYNGGNPTTALVDNTGVLGWTVASDQTSGFKTSDLLWSKTQDPVAYEHGTNNTITGRDRVLTIPYTHAMSKVTIKVICADGFDAATTTANKNFDNASVKLVGVNTKCTLNAPDGKINTLNGPTTTESPLLMQKGTVVKDATADSKKCTFEAIITPSLIKNGNDFAIIEGVDGNKYVVTLSDAIINPSTTDAWSKKLAAGNAADITSIPAATYVPENGGITLPGINYMLTVTIKKQEIKVEAKIADWEQVNAESEAEIKFTTDIKDYVYDPEMYPNPNTITFANGETIDLYKNTGTSFTSRSSKATYTAEVKDTDGKVTTPAYWTCDPVLYWDKEGDKEYFRAIFPTNSTTGGRTITDNKFDITAGEGSSYDVLWGTTAKHTTKKIDGTDGTSYDEGVAIDPRTKEVPLIFYHKTSKVNVVLVTGNSTDPDAVTITNAKIQFTNLYTQNTVNMNDGALGTLSGTRPNIVFDEDITTPTNDKRPVTANQATNNQAATGDLFMIPQEIPTDKEGTPSVDEAAYIIITLSDKTTYKLKLSECKLLKKDADNKLVPDTNPDGTFKYINKWEPGENYTYYINLTKEKIQFFALIKDWKEVNVSGDATMEWDDTIAEDLEAGAPGAGDPDGNHNEERGKGEW